MIGLDAVRAALALPDFDTAAAQAHMIPGSRLQYPPRSNRPRLAGVLVLLYPQAGHWHIVLTRRTETLRGHSGQISFPGGKRDPHDPTFTDTALRETCEELGVCEAVEVIGHLAPVYIPPSNFEVRPTVGVLHHTPTFTPNPGEVAEVFSLSLDTLVDDRTKHEEHWTFQGHQLPVPFYAVQGHKVWGATAIMLSEFEQRLRAVLPMKL